MSFFNMLLKFCAALKSGIY